jgi:hypothetical protein
MGNLPRIGGIFYGTSIAAMGLLTIYHKDFPYMLIPARHSWLVGQVLIIYIFGALLFLAGACITFGKMTRPVSLLLGSVLLLIFVFYFIPYEFLVSPKYMHFGDWENAAKELSLSGGAFAIAGYAGQRDHQVSGLLRKAGALGTIIYSLTIISFSIDHFLYANEAAGYVPAWIPYHVFWLYFCGVALLGSGLGILLNISRRLMATLLGLMIFIWVIILHIPYVIAAHGDDSGGEVTSAFLALAYCGIAFVISGDTQRSKQKSSYG